MESFLNMQYVKIVFVIFCFSSCIEVSPVDDFDANACKVYETEFIKKYKGYGVHNTNNQESDYIRNYISFCRIGNMSITDYDVIQSYQIYTSEDSVVKSTFDYELIHFKQADKIDTIIRAIRMNNCIDEQTLKVRRMYRIGKNALICAAYSGFRITDYEDFLMSVFKKEIQIELINPSQ